MWFFFISDLSILLQFIRAISWTLFFTNEVILLLFSFYTILYYTIRSNSVISTQPLITSHPSQLAEPGQSNNPPLPFFRSSFFSANFFFLPCLLLSSLLFPVSRFLFLCYFPLSSCSFLLRIHSRFSCSRFPLYPPSEI